MRTIVATAFFLLAGQAWCQTGISEIPPPPAPPDAAAYQQFFNELVTLKTLPSQVRITRSTPQEAIGLTDTEATILTGLAEDCRAMLKRLDPKPGETFEALMRSIEAGETNAQLEQRKKDLDDRRDQTVRDHIQQLRSIFGQSRFEVVDAYIRSRMPTNMFFPPIGAPTVVPVRKQ